MEEKYNSVEIEMETTSRSVTETASILPKDEEVPTVQTKNPYWIGSSIAFWYINGKALFTIGPHCSYCLPLGPFYIVLNCIIVPLTILGLYFVVIKASLIAAVIGTILFILHTTSYFLTFIMNPGIPSGKLALYDQLSVDRIKENL